MNLKNIKLPALIAAITAAVTLSTYDPAHAEDRWDGLAARSPNGIELGFGTGFKKQKSSKDRGAEYDFGEKKTYQSQYKTKSFKDKLRETIIPQGPDR